MANRDQTAPLIHIPPWLWLVLSALISFTITAGTALMAAASSLTPGTSLTTFSLLVIGVGGLIQVAKDIKTFIAPWPEIPQTTVVQAPNVVVNIPERGQHPPTSSAPPGTGGPPSADRRQDA